MSLYLLINGYSMIEPFSFTTGSGSAFERCDFSTAAFSCISRILFCNSSRVVRDCTALTSTAVGFGVGGGGGSFFATRFVFSVGLGARRRNGLPAIRSIVSLASTTEGSVNGGTARPTFAASANAISDPPIAELTTSLDRFSPANETKLSMSERASSNTSEDFLDLSCLSLSLCLSTDPFLGLLSFLLDALLEISNN